MDYYRARKYLLIALVAIVFTLYMTWAQERVPEKLLPESQATENITPLVSQGSSIPVPQPSTGTPAVPQLQTQPVVASSDRILSIETDTMRLEIDLKGGDIVKTELRHYPEIKEIPEKGFLLLDRSNNRHYVAQTGLIGPHGPDSHQKGRALYLTDKLSYRLAPGDAMLSVPLSYEDAQGVVFTKIFEFYPKRYSITIRYLIENQTNTAWSGQLYGQLRQKFVKGQGSKSGMLGMQTYRGAALYTPDKPYKKISFDKMQDTPFSQKIKGGWAAWVEHYFVTAWIPDPTLLHSYYTRVDAPNFYNIGSLVDVHVPAYSTKTVEGQLYVGPEITEDLKKISDGLDLTVDYGFLWPISQFLFFVMKYIYQWLGNWGWSIIVVTLCIKLAFYRLSAASYRSMGKMQKIQPKIQALKAQYGDNKQQFSQELMAFYKKEKINPLGGCLPILIQIPVFIALYYVLLESVELRQASFIFWLDDLSAKDPYFVLPILMGLSMLVQQKLSPQALDPMQAKIMMLMPVIFTVLFLSFPSGLVLYWLANNVLSILQQWYITRKLQRETLVPRRASK